MCLFKSASFHHVERVQVRFGGVVVVVPQLQVGGRPRRGGRGRGRRRGRGQRGRRGGTKQICNDWRGRGADCPPPVGQLRQGRHAVPPVRPRQRPRQRREVRRDRERLLQYRLRPPERRRGLGDGLGGRVLAGGVLFAVRGQQRHRPRPDAVAQLRQPRVEPVATKMPHARTPTNTTQAKTRSKR